MDHRPSLLLNRRQFLDQAAAVGVAAGSALRHHLRGAGRRGPPGGQPADHDGLHRAGRPRHGEHGDVSGPARSADRRPVRRGCRQHALRGRLAPRSGAGQGESGEPLRGRTHRRARTEASAPTAISANCWPATTSTPSASRPPTTGTPRWWWPRPRRAKTSTARSRCR